MVESLGKKGIAITENALAQRVKPHKADKTINKW